MRKLLTNVATAALVGVGVLTLSVGAASAYVVCNNEGDCWHTDQRYHYRPGIHIQFYPDSWYFHRDWDHDRDHRWRGHHDERGYWHNGVWVTF